MIEDENRLEPVYYRITINAANLDGSGKSEEKKGFIDHKKIRDYDPLPSTFELSLRKARANLRYRMFLFLVSETHNPWLDTVKDNGGATADSNGSSFSITLSFEKKHYVFTYDEFNNNAVINGEDSLRRQTARVFAKDFTEFLQVYDPRVTSDEGLEANNDRTIKVNASSPADGNTLEDKVLNAENEITVVQISNITDR